MDTPRIPPTPTNQPVNEADLGPILVRNGLITGEQLVTAQRYAKDHNLDLRQAILELGLIPNDRLNALAFERLSELALQSQAANGPPGTAAPSPPSPLSPDRTKIEGDIRNQLREVAETAGPIDLVEQIFERACQCRATDIHFDPQPDGSRIRYRIDGQLHDVLTLDTDLTTPLISRMKVMANMNIVERRHPQDGRIPFRHLDMARDLRVATFPTTLGEKIVIRIHEALTEAHGFEELGLSRDQIEIMGKICDRPYGALLVAGPVGAGKTTTLYSCISRVNTPTRNVMTIEDPIEYRLPGVNQAQVEHRGDTPLTFGESLKAMLRQDPNVIMVGEIRDDETARISIRAAMTGVFVFSSIHASDAASTIGNLYNFGIPGYQLSNSLQGVVSQRLVRKICPYCRIKYTPEATVLASLDLDPDVHQELMFSRGLGCPACFQSGYLGRTGIFEVLPIGEELRELVFRQTPKEVLRQVAVDLGMRTLKQSAVDKVLEGTTTVEEIFRVTPM